MAIGTAAWTFVALQVFLGTTPLPHGKSVALAYPVGLLIVALYSRRYRRAALKAAGWSSLICAAFLLAPLATKSSLTPIALFATLAAAFVCSRYPAPSVVALVLLTSTLGSTLAVTGDQFIRGADLILAGLWLGVLARFASSASHPRRRLWPAVALCIGYLAITFVEIFTAATPAIGIFSFRTSAWYMMAVILVAYAGWPALTYRRITRGLVVVTALVAGYAVLRWQIGPSAAEASRAQTAANGINIVNGQLRTVGSFSTGHELALWTGFMAPFTMAFAMASRGRWRLWGVVATALCVFAILASEARGPLVGMVVGLLLVVALCPLAKSFTRIRAAVIASSIAATAAVAVVAFALVVGGSGTATRYTNIFHPSNDLGYSLRQGKWTQALQDISHHPLGQGLGTAGLVKDKTDPTPTVASANLDSSYLKIAYEQGFAVMVLFAVGWLAVGGRLAIAGISTKTPEVAATAIGAVGTLASVLVSFYTGLYIESVPVIGAWVLVGLGMARLVTEPAGSTGSLPTLDQA